MSIQADVLSAEALVASRAVERHRLILAQALEHRVAQRAPVHEVVLSVFPCDECETLVGLDPCDFPVHRRLRVIVAVQWAVKSRRSSTFRHAALARPSMNLVFSPGTAATMSSSTSRPGAAAKAL